MNSCQTLSQLSITQCSLRFKDDMFFVLYWYLWCNHMQHPVWWLWSLCLMPNMCNQRPREGLVSSVSLTNKSREILSTLSVAGISASCSLTGLLVSNCVGTLHSSDTRTSISLPRCPLQRWTEVGKLDPHSCPGEISQHQGYVAESSGWDKEEIRSKQTKRNVRFELILWVQNFIIRMMVDLQPWRKFWEWLKKEIWKYECVF